MMEKPQDLLILTHSAKEPTGRTRFSEPERKSSHEVSITGGNDKSSYYTSFGYFDQSGIVMSDISYYKRINARFNSSHKVTDYLTLGQTFAYTHTKSQGVSANEEFGGPLASAVNLDPITPEVVTDWSKVDPVAIQIPILFVIRMVIRMGFQVM
jgi:hypothetical protein